MVPIKTKNNPRAKERATIVIVLGEAIFRHRACSQSRPTKLNENRGRFPGEDAPGGRASGSTTEMATRWSPPLC